MKIVTLIGVRGSGKTTTVTELVKAIRRRGQTVGTCKSIGCPAFSIDQKGTNTRRHMLAGANLVCARGKRETSLIYPERLPLSQILRSFEGMDWVLLEGDAASPVPRLVAAREEADALERTNDYTLAYVGRIACVEDVSLPHPAFDPLTQAEELLDFLETHLPDTPVTEALDVPLNDGLTKKNALFCAAGCTHHGKQAVSVSIGGEEVRLTQEQKEQILSWFRSDPSLCP